MACTEPEQIQSHDNRMLGRMIKQTFKHSDGDIRIENAETLDEARKEGFPEGVFTRYFIGDKPVSTYGEVIQYILKSAKRGSMFQPPKKDDLKTMQQNMIREQKNMMITQLENLKKSYGGANVHPDVLKQFDKAIEAIDLSGVRVTQ